MEQTLTVEEWRSKEVYVAESPIASDGTFGCSPSLGGNSLDGQGEGSSQQSTKMGISRESGQLGQTGRGFRVTHI